MNIQERIKKFAEDQKKARPGGPTAEQELGAEAEVVVRGPDGKIKGKYKAERTEITI